MKAQTILILLCVFLGSLLQLENVNASNSKKTSYDGDGWFLRFSNYHPTKQVISVAGNILSSPSEMKDAAQVFADIDPRKELILDVSQYGGGRTATAEELVNSIRNTCESKRDKSDPKQSCDIISYTRSSGGYEYCASSCIIAFMAGKKRVACPNAQIGFHSFGFRLPGFRINATQGFNMSLMLSLGVFKSWLEKNMHLFESSTMTNLTPQQMMGSNIVTDIDEKCDYVQDANEWMD